jgi:hypothetical protein
VLTAHVGPPKIARRTDKYSRPVIGGPCHWSLKMLPRRCGHEHEDSLNGHLASWQNSPPSALATLLQYRAARARESQPLHWLTPLGPPVLAKIST